MKFSVILPTYNRAKQTIRSLNSLAIQTFRDFETIVIDDCSTDDTLIQIPSWNKPKDFNLKIHTQPTRQERVAARNLGMRESVGEWICWIDSDDEYVSRYLEIVNDAINLYPEYKIFNFGSLFQYHRSENDFNATILPTFKPNKLEVGHENFRSGKITTGTFVFHRSILNDIPMMTPAIRPYGDPGCFPELNRNPNYPMREDGQWVPMGNPFGEDYHWFWLMTRKYHSMPFDSVLYIRNIRP